MNSEITSVCEMVASLSLVFCDAVTLARVCCSSKVLAASARSAVEQNGQLLITRTLAHAAAAGTRHVEALRWLLRAGKYAPIAIQKASDSILRIPCVNRDAAELLVAAGLQLTWSQIVAAASMRIAGIEVWVAAGAANLESPAVARLFCYHVYRLADTLEAKAERLWDYLPFSVLQQMDAALAQLPPSDIPGVLHVACNITNGPGPAASLLRFMTEPWDFGAPQQLSDQQRQLLQEQVTPELLQWLLETVCLSRGTSLAFPVIRHLAGLSAARHIPHDTVYQWMQSAVQRQQRHVLEHLLHFEQARAVSTVEVQSLLQQGIQNSDAATVRTILRAHHELSIPAVQELQPDVVYDLLTLLVQQMAWVSRVFERMLLLPGAQALATAAVEKLLHLTLQQPLHCSYECEHGPTKLLLELPAVAELQAGAIAAMLRLALLRADLQHAVLLLQHAAAQDLEAADVDELLGLLLQRKGLTRRGCFYIVLRQVCKLPAAAQVGSTTASHLALQQAGEPGFLLWLLWMPLAQKLDVGTVSQLLLNHHGDIQVMHRLLRLPAAQQIESNTVGVLLEVTVFSSDGPSLVPQILHLPAAGNLDAERVAQLIQACLQVGRSVIAQCLIEHLVRGCQGQLTAATLVDVLRSAILQDSSVASDTVLVPVGLISSFCKSVRGTEAIDAGQVAGLVLEAVAVGRAQHAVGLLSIPSAEDLTSDHIANILHQNLAQVQYTVQNVELVQRLCAADGARDITPAQLHALLRSAIRQQGTFRTQMQRLGYYGACEGKPTKLEIEMQAAWDGILAALCKLSAAAGYTKSGNTSSLQQHLQPAAVTELLQHATRSGNPTAVVALCKLPGAAGIDTGAAAQLLAAAAQHKSCSSEYELLWPVAFEAVLALLGLPAVQAIGPDNTASILRIALQHVHEQGGSALGCVDGSEDTDFQQKCCPLVSGVFGLPGARRLSKQIVSDLVGVAAVHGNVSAMLALQQL